MEKSYQYRNKRIAVLGLSVEGLDVTKFLVKERALVTCCDQRSSRQLGALYKKLSKLPVKFQLGNDYLKVLDKYDVLVRTPGMSLNTPELIKAKKKGILITSLTKIFFEKCQAPIIGVTGTKGKGTTSTLIYEMLKQDNIQAYLGGNVGVPLLSKVRTFKPTDWIILELSSFQLEDLSQSPHIAVILKITQEHLANFDPLSTNFHHDRASYIEAKTSIVKFQKSTDYSVVNADNSTSYSFSKMSLARKYFFGRNQQIADAFVSNSGVYLKWRNKRIRICRADQIKLRGQHNLENIAAATMAAKIVGVKIPSIRNIATKFPGLEHRLELVQISNGVTYYNDSFSTTPETAIAALKSFKGPKILITGGSEKGSDYSELGQEICRSNVVTLILIGKMAKRIKTAVIKSRNKNNSLRFPKIITGLTSMAEVVKSASNISKKGDIVLLSPACASFDMFKNYKDRGRQFKFYVKKLAT